MSETMADIYELSKLQFAVLTKAATCGNRVFAVLEPNEEIDTPSHAHQLTKELKEFQELLPLGLVEDVSKDFSEPIAVSKLNNKRGFIVLALTEAGYLMFNECQDPDCTTHKKRLSC